MAAIDLHYFQTPATPPSTPVTTVGSGVAYIRWGRTSCPTVDGTEDIYNGTTAGSHYTHTGGGSNYICMVTDARYHSDAITNIGLTPNSVYGTEYETGGHSLHSLHNNNVPCAACLVITCSVQLMIPGTDQCPGGWTTEYTRWLMSNSQGHKARTTYVCVDKDAQALPGLETHQDVALVYHVNVNCNHGIPCPPYVEAKELACAVCTK